MKKTKTLLEDCYEIELDVFGDNRGWFMESYSEETFKALDLNYRFIQDNHSYSSVNGTLRGLHLQKEPYSQAKLIRCIRGIIFDVAVDLRKESPTYKKWVAVELSEENKKMFLIPRGFAHGFLTLTPDVEVQYKVDNLYSKESEIGFSWNDPDIKVDWGIENPVLSEKDANAPKFIEIEHQLIKHK